MPFPTFNRETQIGRQLACSACGGFEFERSMSEQGSIVNLFLSDEITDEVIRKGRAHFLYRCLKCGKNPAE